MVATLLCLGECGTAASYTSELPYSSTRHLRLANSCPLVRTHMLVLYNRFFEERSLHVVSAFGLAGSLTSPG
jgi:hypothetical protein